MSKTERVKDPMDLFAEDPAMKGGWDMKISRAFLIQGLALSLVLVCLGAPAVAGEVVRLSIATGPVNATWYPLGGAMTKIVGKQCPDIAITLETGNAVKNCRTVGGNPNVIALTNLDNAYFAVKGEGDFKEKIPLAAMMKGHFSQVHILSLEEFGINRVEDLRGKTVGIGAPASGHEATARPVLATYGITYQDIKAKWLGPPEMVDALKDKTIAAAFIFAGIPVPGITELAITHKIKLIPIRQEMIAKIIEKYPYFSAYQIPAGTYKGQSYPVDTLGIESYLVANAALSQNVVYKIVKAIGENVDELAAIHPLGKFWTAERAAQNIIIPRHPGSESYLRERGLLK
jgi:TRAP transporter TAXI family solute receptor